MRRNYMTKVFLKKAKKKKKILQLKSTQTVLAIE